MHICLQQHNLTRLACCQLMLLINESSKLPFCDFDGSLFDTDPQNAHNLSAHTTPLYLTAPSSVPEDHLTFAFGIVILFSIAVCCTMVISRLSKPRSRSRLSVNGAWSHYEVAIWIRCGKRISVNPMFMMLKGIYCPTPISRNPSLSVVFNPGITMLPSYRTATTAASSTGSLPPPPYFETQSLVQQPPRTCCECEGIDEEVSSIPTSNAAT